MMELSVQEKNSSVWHKVDAHLSELILNAQRKNEAPLSEIETAEIRGRIRAYRVLRSIGEDHPLINDDELPE